MQSSIYIVNIGALLCLHDLLPILASQFVCKHNNFMTKRQPMERNWVTNIVFSWYSQIVHSLVWSMRYLCLAFSQWGWNTENCLEPADLSLSLFLLCLHRPLSHTVIWNTYCVHSLYRSWGEFQLLQEAAARETAM